MSVRNPYNGSTQASRPSNRELRRAARDAINAGTQAVLTLLAVLAQQGGEVTVTQGTIDQCAKNLNDLDFVIVPSPTAPREYIVRLVEGHDAERLSAVRASGAEGVIATEEIDHERENDTEPGATNPGQ